MAADWAVVDWVAEGLVEVGVASLGFGRRRQSCSSHIPKGTAWSKAAAIKVMGFFTALLLNA